MVYKEFVVVDELIDVFFVLYDKFNFMDFVGFFEVLIMVLYD